jgi:hypothetical protein
MTQQNKKQRGYIALMATIVISLILLVMVVEEGSSGWFARFNILGTEAKEQASSLAEGCAEQALATLLTDPNYTGDVTMITSGGTCHVLPVLFNSPVAGLVTIKTQAIVRDSYANLDMAMNMNDIHLNAIPSAPTTGTLFITTHVVNDGSGTKQASDFMINVAANPSSSPAGSESGTVVTVQPGPFSVSGSPMANYSVSSGCSDSIGAGEIKYCTITYNDITTTLTVLANVVNNNSGTKSPADFPLFIDSAPVSLGQRVTVAEGVVHTVSATTPSGYAASLWGYDCDDVGKITLSLGQNKTCIINFDDLPPPTPECAETVMMLDRTGSMGTTDLADEKTAANSLISLYSTVSPLPKMSVGVFGDRSDDNGLAPAGIVGQLTTAYSTLTSALNSWLNNSSGYTNLADAISKSSDELNSVRHVAGKEKVLILISDGDPNRPTGSTSFDTGFNSTASSIQNGTSDSWNNPAGAYADSGLDATSTVSSGNRERFYTFGFGGGAGLPAGGTIAGIEAQLDAWATGATGGLTTIFTDNFGTGSSVTDVPNWNEDGSTAGTQAQALGSGDNSASPDGGRFALIEGSDGWICREVNATNLSSLVLKYYWRGDSDAESSDQGVVEYNSSGSCASYYGWSNLKTHVLNVTSWSSLQSVNLPSSLNDDNSFFIRFRSASNSTNESLRIDNVSVTGTSIPALACQIGVDLSWNGGSSWTSEKTQTLTGTEATYTLGSGTDDWTSSHTWQPAEFSNTNFRARVHAIDPGSACDNSAVDHLDWLQLKVHYNQSTDPVQAALNAADSAKSAGVDLFTIHFGDDPSGYNGRELLANLASGATPVSGHQNGSLADAGGVVSGNTGAMSPNAQAADTGGSGNGFEVSPTKAFADGPSGTSGAAQNINGAGDKHRYYDYNLVIPPNATVTGISTRLDWWLDSTSGTNSLGVELSWDGGAHWTSIKNNTSESTSSSHSDTLGGSTDNWGHTWTAANLSNANFRVRITSNSTYSSRDFYLDWVPVTVYYSVIQENGDGDNFFISPTSADMEGIFHFIGEEVCPALLSVTPTPPPTTGTLMIMTQVVNNNGGAKLASDFNARVSADNPSQNSFAGSETGISVTVNPGDYSITEDPVSGYTESIGATCSSAGSSGGVVAGETRVCILSNDDLPPPPPPPNLIIDPNSWHEIPTAN